MKIIGAFLILVFTSFYIHAQNYEFGDVVNDFTVVDTQGNTHNLYDITAQGKYVLLDFFFVECVPCQGTAPVFNEFYAKYGCNDGDIYCLGINNGTNDNAQVEAFKAQFGGNFPSAPAASADGNSGAVDEDFGIFIYPSFILIDSENKFVISQSQFIDSVQDLEVFPVGFNPQPMECQPILSIENAVFLNEITMYPNPVKASQSLQISLPETIESSVVLFDILGKQMHIGNYNTSLISIPAEMTTGMYIVRVSTDKGTISKTLVVQ